MATETSFPLGCVEMERVILISFLHYLQARWGFYGFPMNFYEPCVGSGKVSPSGYTYYQMIVLYFVALVHAGYEMWIQLTTGKLVQTV